MNSIIEYKGYHTKIEFEAETETLRGKIEGINDYIDFEANTIPDIIKEFHAAVDDYLDFCVEVGKKPEKEYKGSFNVRVTPELHRKMAYIALLRGGSLNAEVEKAIEEYVYTCQQLIKGHTTNTGPLTEMISMNDTKYYNETRIDSNNIIPFTNYSFNDEVREQ